MPGRPFIILLSLLFFCGCNRPIILDDCTDSADLTAATPAYPAYQGIPAANAQLLMWLYSDAFLVREMKKSLFRYLCSDDFVLKQENLGGTEPKFIATFGNGLKGLFKIHTGTYPNNSYSESSASGVDQYFQFDVVPLTVLRKMDGNLGSLQVFVNGAVEGGSDLWVRPGVPYDVDQRLAGLPVYEKVPEIVILDFIIANVDRKSANWLRLPEMGNRAVAIDHGLSFLSSQKIQQLNGGQDQPEAIIRLVKDRSWLVSAFKDFDEAAFRRQFANAIVQFEDDAIFDELIARIKAVRNGL